MERAFYQLLNQEGNVDNDATDHLTARETIVHLNDPITMEELRKAVKAANIGKARHTSWSHKTWRWWSTTTTASRKVH